MKFKLYYDDTSVIEGKTPEEWNRAPVDGILFVAVQRDERWEVYSSHDFYFFHDQNIGYTHDLNPLLRKLRFIKFGRWASPERMNEVRKKVEEDTNQSIESF